MTDEWERRQQFLRRVFDGVLPSAEQRRKYHISLRDVRALGKFIPIYKEYLRSEIRDLNGDVDDLEYRYKKLEEENEKLKEEIERLETEVQHLS